MRKRWMFIPVVLAALTIGIIGSVACGEGSPVADTPIAEAKGEVELSRAPTQTVPAYTLTTTPSNSSFTITSKLCSDEQGPDCTKLRLGDDYLTTSKPEKGYLYSCNEKNPNAPGSIESKITWINFVEKAWNFLQTMVATRSI